MKRTRLFLLFSLLTGCAGLIGVPDLTLEDEPAEGGTLDGSTVADGRADGTTPPVDSGPHDASPVDAGDASTDAATCDLSKTDVDTNNCGSCGHICSDNNGCAGGVCNAVQLTTITGAGLIYVVEHGDYLYATASYALSSTDVDGIYRISKSTGATVKYVTKTAADRMVVLGDTLYFETYSSLSSGEGGLWACDLAAPGTTCTPRLIAEASYPGSLAVNGGKVFFTDYGNGAIRAFDPTADAGDAGTDVTRIPSVATLSVGSTYNLFVDGTKIYLVNRYTDQVTLNLVDPTGTTSNVHSTFTVDQIQDQGVLYGELLGTASSVFYTAAADDTSLVGVVRRLSRATNTEDCDYGLADGGTSSVFRPTGLYLDSTRIYWTNRGNYGPSFSKGSIATCEIAGCCKDAKILWSSGGGPTAIVGDATHLYWVTAATGQVFKTVKP